MTEETGDMSFYRDGAESTSNRDRKAFDMIMESLKRQGANIEVVTTGNNEYVPETDTIRVHDGDRKAAIEEAFHRKQFQMLAKEGITPEDMHDPVLICAAELEIITRFLILGQKEKQRVQQRTTKERSIFDRTSDDVGQFNETIDNNFEESRFKGFSSILHRTLEKMTPQERVRYKTFFSKSLLAAGMFIYDMVEEGMTSDDVWGPDVPKQKELETDT